MVYYFGMDNTDLTFSFHRDRDQMKKVNQNMIFLSTRTIFEPEP